MGNSCSCLNNITSLCSEDLSHGANDGTKNYINNDPKRNLSSYAISEKDPMISQRNTTNELNTISSRSNKNNTKRSNNKSSSAKKNNNTKNNKKSNNKNNNNKNNKNENNNKSNYQDNNSINTDIKSQANTKFEQFLNSEKAKQLENNPSSNLSLKLHKYFLKILVKKKFLKRIKYYKQEGDKLFKLSEEKIYNNNEILSKAEKSCKLKYTKDGYKQFYPNITPNEEEKMKFIPKEKKTLDNSVIINYQNDNNDISLNTIDNINWIYKGQTNIENKPNGYGVKYVKNGIKQEGYWKEGQQIGWCQSIDFQGNIMIGPFVDDGKITGKGIKFSYLNNTFYKGDIVKNQKEGKGEEISNEGIFCGNYLNDKKNGEGKMVYSLSGDVYEGNYKDDLFDGKGHYIWKISGQEYTGEYKNGLMHGKGLYEWSEGEYYRGSFVNGKKEGNGEMHWANGRSFVGPFVNGRPQGVGIFDNGINYKGEMEFIDGKLNKDYLSKKYRGSESNSLQYSTEQVDNFL